MVFSVNEFVFFSLQSIRKSECPKELEPADKRSSVHVNLIRRDENCPVSPYLYSNFLIGTYVSDILFYRCWVMP